LNKKWLSELAQEHFKRGKIPFYANVRADLVDDEVVGHLKKGGCVSVAMGIEAGNPLLRNQILNRDLDNSRIIKAAKLIRASGIKLLTFNIIALPGGGIKEDMETLDLNIEAGVDYPSVSFMIPFPKTRIFDLAKDSNLLPETEINYDEGYYQKPIIKVANPEKHVRLLWLFALAVEFPIVRKHLLKLLDLPLDPIYSLAYKLWKGYTGKSRIFPHKRSMSDMGKAIWNYLTKLQR